MTDSLRHLIEATILNQGGALILGTIVTLLVLGDLTRLRSRRNLRVVLLLLSAVFLIDIVKWEFRSDEDWAATGLLFAFRGLQITLIITTVAAIVLALRRREAAPSNLPTATLRVLAIILVATNIAITLGRDPDDCGIYSNLGAQRWQETDQLPYNDSALKGPNSPGHGAAATYGPLLYLAHIPLQLALGTNNNPESTPVKNTDLYQDPPAIATQLTALLFHFVGLAALYLIGRRCSGTATRWALVVAYAGCPYILGLGGEAKWLGGADAFACGLSYISHIAPISLVLMALAFTPRPAVAGGLLAGAAGVLYFPAFLFPAFLGWFWKRGEALRFLAGFMLIAVLTTAVVLNWTAGDSIPDRIAAFTESTFDHQEGSASDQYGRSQYSFWGQHDDLASSWKRPLLGDSSFSSPVFIGLTGLALLTLLLARGRSLGQLCFLLAAVAAAVQLWKTHAAGTYVEWYYPLLLIGFLCPRVTDPGD